MDWRRQKPEMRVRLARSHNKKRNIVSMERKAGDTGGRRQVPNRIGG